MTKHEYHEGPDARKSFEETMQKLFRAPKTVVQKPPKPKTEKGGNEK